jgi:hypothetical protein
MSNSVTCPNCQAVVRASNDITPQQLVCPECHTPFAVPVVAQGVPSKETPGFLLYLIIMLVILLAALVAVEKFAIRVAEDEVDKVIAFRDRHFTYVMIISVWLAFIVGRLFGQLLATAWMDAFLRCWFTTAGFGLVLPAITSAVFYRLYPDPWPETMPSMVVEGITLGCTGFTFSFFFGTLNALACAYGESKG